MNKVITAEEKLLKLIRKKKDSASAASGDSNQTSSNPLEQKKKGLEVDFLTILNRLFILLIVAISVYIIGHYLMRKEESVPLANGEKKLRSGDIEERTSRVVALSELKPFDMYQGKIMTRDIFLSPWEKQRTNDAFGANNPASPSALSQQLKIVGIVLDQDPKAILEDIKSQQTFFVSEGEEVMGATLKQIQEDKLIFIYNGQRVELTP